MKSTQVILLVIGILSVTASIFGTITGVDFTMNLTGYICGSSLIMGYFDLKKKQQDKSCSSNI